jgi:hypothetical protein
MPDVWFSAMLRVVTSVAGKPSSVWRTLVVFRAADWPDARNRAVALGRDKEDDYANGDGESVEHRLIAVETLDALGEEIDDGREVWFESGVPSGDLAPKLDEDPGQSGV